MSFKIGKANIIVEAYVPNPDVIASARGAVEILKKIEKLEARNDKLERVREVSSLLAGKTSGWRTNFGHKLPEDWVAGMELLETALKGCEEDI